MVRTWPLCVNKEHTFEQESIVFSGTLPPNIIRARCSHHEGHIVSPSTTTVASVHLHSKVAKEKGAATALLHKMVVHTLDQDIDTSTTPASLDFLDFPDTPRRTPQTHWMDPPDTLDIFRHEETPGHLRRPFQTSIRVFGRYFQGR